MKGGCAKALIFGMSKRVYIDLNPLLSAPAWWKEAFTDRGDGKTSAIVKTAINSRIESGLTATLCRRVKKEMGAQFKGDILAKIKKFCPAVWEKCDFVWSGSFDTGGLYLIDKNEPNARPYIHAFPLTLAGKMKSGLDVETHRNLYIDEYVPLDGNYLPNEVEAILELYRTIDRDMLLEVDPYLNYVLICGNRIGRAPATDIYFNIDHDYNSNALKLYKNGTIAVFTYANKGHSEDIKQSKLADLTAGTPYAGYAAGGVLRGITPQLWARKLPPVAFIVQGTTSRATIYLAPDGGIIIQAGSEYNSPATCLTIDPTDNSGYIWIKRADKLCALLRRAFALGRVYYANKYSAELCIDITTYLSRL